MNQLFNQLNPTRRQLPDNIKTMINMYRNLSNPQQLAIQALQSNPQLSSAINKAGGNAEKAFRDMASKVGIDADEFIAMLK